MKQILYFCLSILFLQSIEAQEKYMDSLYEVEIAQRETYAKKGDQELVIDLYQPKNSDLKRPLIIFMHGGGFAGGSPENSHEVEFAKITASRGYTAGLISYRLTRKNQSFGCDYEASRKIKTFQLAAEDFMDAVHFMNENAEKYNIDPSRIIVGGSSAGAEAVLNAVYNPDLMFEKSEKYKNLKFSAVLSLAGALLDVRYLKKEQAVPGILFHGIKDNLVPYTTAPHHYCKPSEPGYLILDGSKTIADKLEELDTSFLFYTFENAGHGIAGMPFDHLPEVIKVLNSVVFENNKIQSRIYR